MAALRRFDRVLGNPELDSLNSVKYLYLRELAEPRDNSLRVIVDEAVVNPSGQVRLPGLPELSEIVKNASAIETTAGCKSFELSWKLYVAYLVTEEMVGSCGKSEDEDFTGHVLRVYSKSHFLDHLARDTGCHSEPILHYKLICLNHLIDVASYVPPEVRQIDPPSEPSHRIQ
jgi:hypothetical protein